MSVKQYKCWGYSRHWYLVEMFLDIPASEIEWDQFVVPENDVDPANWQCPYLEQYLNEEGTKRLCGVYEVPGQETGYYRVAFFLYKTSGTMLRTPYGEFPLSDEKIAPERLRACLDFEEEVMEITTGGAVTLSYAVTKKRYCAWAIERNFSGFRAVVSLSLCLLGGLAFGMGIAGGFRPLFLVPSCFFLYYALLRDVRRAAKEYDRLADEYGEKDWKLTIILEESRILWDEGAESGEYAYSDIKSAYERKDRFCLAMLDGRVLQLYKEGLQEYTADQCWDRIVKNMDEAVNK